MIPSIFIHSSIRYLLETYYVPGTVLIGVEDRAGTRADASLPTLLPSGPQGIRSTGEGSIGKARAAMGEGATWNQDMGWAGQLRGGGTCNPHPAGQAGENSVLSYSPLPLGL